MRTREEEIARLMAYDESMSREEAKSMTFYMIGAERLADEVDVHLFTSTFHRSI